MKHVVGSLCASLPRLGRRERCCLLGCAMALASRREERERRENTMEREELVYHGGKRTQQAQVNIQLHKQPGSDRFCQVIEASSTAAAMDALEALIRGYEVWLGVPAHHVLAVLATVMTAPGAGRMEL